jgi:hypothetical protein
MCAKSIELSPRVWLASGKNASAVIKFGVPKVQNDTWTYGNRLTVTADGVLVDIFSWGKGNNLPTLRQDIVMQNNIVPQIMRTTRNLLLGNGLFYYKKVFKDGVESLVALPFPTLARTFFDANDFETVVLPQLARDLIMNSMFIPEFVRNLDGTINSVKAIECAHARSGLQDDKGKVRAWYWNGGWGKPLWQNKFTTTAMQLYDGTDKQAKFIMVLGDAMFHNDYYNIPVWEGAKDWIELANLIPLFHISNINNRFTPSWHIETPSDYFVDVRKYPNVDALDDTDYTAYLKDTEAARMRFVERVNSVLAGVKGAGNAIFTEYDISESLVKEYPGIKITPLNATINHEAFIQLFDTSNIANISAFGMPAVVASIQTAGRLSAGSETRNALWLHIITQTPYYRSLLLKVVNFLHRTNKWDTSEPTGEWGFKDVEITKLDDNKLGHSRGTTA